MKYRIILILLVAIINSNCSKKKDDNSLRNLLILGFLSQPKTETVSLTAGVTVRQKINVVAGQEIKYTLLSSSTSSSLLSKSTNLSNRTTVNILDNANKNVYSTVVVPGLEETIKYTPKTSEPHSIIVTPSGSGKLTTSLSGASIVNNPATENSTTSALQGKRKYSIVGSLLNNTFLLVTVEEVTSIGSDGKIASTPLSNAIINFTVDGVASNLTYSSNVIGFMGPGYSTNLSSNPIGKKLRLRITHPSISDINFDKEITASPSYVKNVKASGLSSSANSGTTLNLDRSQPITFTWEMPSSNLPDTTQIQISTGIPNKDIFLFIPADKLSYTVPKELLSGLTTNSTSDDCIGSIGAAGSANIFDPDYFIGLDATGTPRQSGFSVIGFNFNNSLQPLEGYYCEAGTINPLTKDQNTPNGFTFNSAGIPLLVVK